VPNWELRPVSSIHSKKRDVIEVQYVFGKSVILLGPNLDDLWIIHQSSIKSMDGHFPQAHFFICTNPDSILYQEFNILCLVNQLKLPINFLGQLCSPFTKKKNPWIIHIHACDHPSMDIPEFDHPSWALNVANKGL
jgi:hypothetical protein